MNNILYIGPYRENNGLGRSSRRWLKCLQSDNNINVCSRPIYLTQNTIFHNDEVFDFNLTENNKADKYDIVIQHGTPDVFVFDRRFGKNIGIVEIETKNIGHSGWVEKINMLDEVVVGSSFSASSLLGAGVKIPIKIIPEPYDTYDYNNHMDFFYYPNEQSRPFIFYTIGQYFEKKNIQGIILAFLLEFNDYDNVKLFIKTGDYYQDNSTLENIIKYDVANMHKAVKRHHIKDNRIDILCGLLKDEDIYRLHKSGDCYVNTVKSDANGACAIEAALCDSFVINTKNIGSNDFINPINGYIVDSINVNVYSRDFYSAKILTTYEEWYEPNIYSIRNCMRKAYESSAEERAYMINNFDKDLFRYKNTLSKLL